MDVKRESRQAAGLLLGGTAGSLVLMLHHPTSLRGADDGQLLHDWSNGAVHGGMILCLWAIGLAGPTIIRRLGPENLGARAGGLAFGSGIAAFVAAGLVNGFAAEMLAARSSEGDFPAQFGVLAALNQTLALFGIGAVAAAMALWSPRLIRLGGFARAAGAGGIAAGGLAAWWLTAGGGAFGLYPAVVATGVFGAWSALIAAWMLRGEEEAGR